MHFLMPFIDFAFMVIIIFLALLSIAYFEPPGMSVKKESKEKIFIPLLKKKEIKRQKEEVNIYKQKLVKQKKFYEKMTEKYKMQIMEKEIALKKLQEKIKILEKRTEEKGVGKHEFTDLRR